MTDNKGLLNALEALESEEADVLEIAAATIGDAEALVKLGELMLASREWQGDECPDYVLDGRYYPALDKIIGSEEELVYVYVGPKAMVAYIGSLPEGLERDAVVQTARKLIEQISESPGFTGPDSEIFHKAGLYDDEDSPGASSQEPEEPEDEETAE